MEIELTDDRALMEDERKRIRGLLPFWAQELLSMKDEAAKKRVREPSVKEGF